MKVGFLHSLIRKDEKLLIGEFRKHRDVELVMLDDRKLIFDLGNRPEVDVVVETRNAEHIKEIVSHLRANGFVTQILSARAAEPTAI